MSLNLSASIKCLVFGLFLDIFFLRFWSSATNWKRKHYERGKNYCFYVQFLYSKHLWKERKNVHKTKAVELSTTYSSEVIMRISKYSWNTNDMLMINNFRSICWMQISSMPFNSQILVQCTLVYRFVMWILNKGYSKLTHRLVTWTEHFIEMTTRCAMLIHTANTSCNY